MTALPACSPVPSYPAAPARSEQQDSHSPGRRMPVVALRATFSSEQEDRQIPREVFFGFYGSAR